jgi:hypothetical protein
MDCVDPRPSGASGCQALAMNLARKAAIVNDVVAYSDQFGDPLRVSGNVRRSGTGLREIIPQETCSRNDFGCWPQPRGRAVPITAAPDGVESFQKARAGK